MSTHKALRDYLTEWAGASAHRQAVASTVLNLAKAGIEVADLVAMGPFAGDMAAKRGDHAHGDSQKELDAMTHDKIMGTLKASPVAWMGSEEDEEAIALNDGAPLAVNVDPIDGSSNIDTNVSIGTIFSILPAEG